MGASNIKTLEQNFNIIYSEPKGEERFFLPSEQQKENSFSEIDASLLATSLSGMHNTIEEANILINGTYSQASIKIIGPFKSGSFIVSVLSRLDSNSIQQIVNVMAIIGFIGAVDASQQSLIKLIKFVKGEKIERKEEIDNDTFRVKFENCQNPVIVEKVIIELYESPQIKKSLSEMVSPLEFPEIDSIAFGSNDFDLEIISKEQKSYFSLPESEFIDQVDKEGYLKVVSPNLDGNNIGWKFNEVDGKGSFFATVLDKKFLNDVKTGKYSFIHGTIILAKYRRTITKIERKHPKYEIIEVKAYYLPNKKLPKIRDKTQTLLTDQIG